MSIPSTEITDFLVHHMFPDFPVCAEALWEITPDTETDERSVGERTRVTADAVAGGSRRGKKRKAYVGAEMNRSSAHVLSVDEKWWPFVMRACEYEESGADDLRTRAVVSIQYAAHWSRENTDEVISKASSRYTGAMVDVVFSLRTFGKGRGLWMKEVDTNDVAVRVRLSSPTPSLKGLVGNRTRQVTDLVGSRNEDFVHVPESAAPTIVPSQSMEKGVEYLHEELNRLRSAFDSRTETSVVARSLGADLKSRLRVIGVSRILECLSASRPPPVTEKFYKFSLDPSRLDGSDTCGNAEVEIYLTDAMFTEFQDFAGVASSSTQSFVGGRSYPSPSWQELSSYNPMSPRPISIVFPFVSDFCAAVGMSPSQRVLDIFKPPRREAVVSCILGSTELFQDSETGIGPCRREVLPGVCRTSLLTLLSLRPNLPDYFVSMLRQVNSSLHSETMQSRNDFSCMEGKSKDLVRDSKRAGVPGTGKSNGFRLKWTPLGWNAKKGVATSGVHGKITVTMSLVYMKDKRLAASALLCWNPVFDATESDAGEDHVSAQALLGNILGSPKTD